MLLHTLDQAVGSHIGPIFVYKLQTSGAGIRIMDYSPSLGDSNIGGPEGMLSLIVDKYVISSVFVFKRITHVLVLSDSTKPPSASLIIPGDAYFWQESRRSSPMSEAASYARGHSLWYGR